ncbi:LOW QUALITY PROTEIN: semaphorin-5A-like [Chiloscyllium punctatum]|uniref:LOW QUALITY PROTEIN: semaphorin-5A-like n=1 Tax=Chiloscyllium punctatum TaxID=137246 RepID=UPI003B640D18
MESILNVKTELYLQKDCVVVTLTDTIMDRYLYVGQIGLFRCIEEKCKASLTEIAHHPMVPIKINWFWAFLLGVVIGTFGISGSSVLLEYQQCQKATHHILTYSELFDCEEVSKRLFISTLPLVTDISTFFSDIAPWLHTFQAADVTDYSQLIFDPSQKELIVGAKNYLYRLKLEDLTLIQRVEWLPDETSKKSCFNKGKMEEECQNYIRVLLINSTKIFTCGMNAFNPICTSPPLTDLTAIHDRISGMARCPYNPQHNSTALITSTGELYAATAMDFLARDVGIYRSLGQLPPLRTAQYNSKWLNEPNFVSSNEIGTFTYFFFREYTVEIDCGINIFPRVARMCKNDIGGQFILENTWTALMKAQLNCSRPGLVRFYYQEVISTFFLPEQDILIGVFTTNINGLAFSAVCMFNLNAINQAFAGPFKLQENSAWQTVSNPNPNFQCGTIDSGPSVKLTERNLQDAEKFILMNEAVEPTSSMPIFLENSSRFSHIVVDIVQGKDMLFHVMYLATDYGTIKKALAPVNQGQSGCLLEEIELFPINQRDRKRNLQILHSQSVLFVGLQEHVIRFPLKRCSFYRSQSSCVGAHDPHCGWDLTAKKCTTLEESTNMNKWEQELDLCP